LQIDSVSYSRLFSLGKESGNERFDFHAKVGEGENPDVVMGQLFLKTAAVEKTLDEYRNTLYSVSRLSDDIKNLQEGIGSLQSEISRKRVELQRLAGKTYEELSELEVERNFCDYRNIKGLIESRARNEEELDRKVKELDELVAKRDSLLQRIREGRFEEAQVVADIVNPQKTLEAK